MKDIKQSKHKFITGDTILLKVKETFFVNINHIYTQSYLEVITYKSYDISKAEIFHCSTAISGTVIANHSRINIFNLKVKKEKISLKQEQRCIE